MKRRNLNERIQLVWLGGKSSKDKKRVDELELPDAAKLHDQIKSEASQLESAIARFDKSTLLPLIVVLNMARSAQVRRGYVDPNSPAFIEYITALALKNNVRNLQYPSIKDATAIRDLSEKIFWLCNEYCAAQFYSSEHADEDKWNILTNARLNYMLVRGETYDTYFLEMAQQLFDSQARYLEQKFGFNIAQAIAFVKTISRLKINRFEKEKERLITVFTELASTEVNATAWPIGIYKKKRSQKQSVEAGHVLNTLPELARGLFFISEQELLQNVNSNDQDSLVSFLKWVSIEPGQVDGKFTSPLDDNPLQDTPVVKLDQAYLFHSSAYLARCLFYSLDKELMGDSLYREKYNRLRSRYLEQESLRLFKKIFPTAAAYNRLKYNVIENSRRIRVELDVLVQHDNNLFLIECATHPVTQASKKGVKEPIVHDIQQSIERTFRQARRAKDYIKMSDQAEFTLSDGSTITIDKRSIKNYFLISVTFDSFDVLAADPRKLKSLGLFSADEYPWPIYIGSLSLISDFIDFPSQFVHYFKKRMSVSEKVYASDELDYFGCYFILNLEIPMPKVTDPIEKIHIVNATSDFDQYFYYKRGLRLRVPRPGQFIPRHLKSILLALERIHNPGYTDVCCSLLDISYPFRKAIEESIVSTLRRSKDSGGALKDFTIIDTSNQWGFTYFCGDGTQKPNLERMMFLPEYCVHKMDEAGILSWVGLARDTSSREPFMSMFFSEGENNSNSK